MKKLLSLAIALICTLSLSVTAFAAETAPDAFSIYQKYIQKSKSISSMRLSVVQKLSMTDGKESVELTKQNVEVKMLITPDNKLQMEMIIDDSATNETAYAYFKDNYLYEKVGDNKFKIAMNVNEAMASATYVDLNLSKDTLKDAKVEKVDDGTKITYVTNISSLEEASNNSVASLFNNLELPENIKMNISNMTSSITIGDDGMLKSAANIFNVTISDGKDSFDIKISQNAKVNLINAFTNIDFPLDLATYKAVQ